MKIKPAQSDNSFKPVEITFVFESQDEMDALAALFNHTRICCSLRACLNQEIGDKNELPSIIRDGLVKHGAIGDKMHSKFVSEMNK